LTVLGPAVRSVGIVVGRRINAFYEKLRRDHGSSTSPYIHKLRINLALQVSVT
jgi:hypothetical protein